MGDDVVQFAGDALALLEQDALALVAALDDIVASRGSLLLRN